jgi:hypothetical protein
MLGKIFLIFLVFTFQISAKEFGVFSKVVPSKSIFPVCVYDKKAGDETGIFYIDYREKEITHTFLILRGIVPSTCKRLERESLKLKKKNSFLKLSGGSGHDYPEEKNITWRWNSLRSEKDCVSYFVHECQ